MQKIVDWPLPQTGKQLQQFLGFVGYYQGFIPKIAELTFEMNSMKKHQKPKWTPDTEKKFQTLKAHFTEAPLRSYPDYTSAEPFILDTDWSKTNIAAILSQGGRGEVHRSRGEEVLWSGAELPLTQRQVSCGRDGNAQV